MDVEDIHSLPDITGANSSIRAWRLIQINTCTRLADVCRQLDDIAAAQRYAEEADAKTAELRDGVDVATSTAKSRLEALDKELQGLQQRIRRNAEACAAKKMPVVLYGDVTAWLHSVQDAYDRACRREARSRRLREQADGHAVQVLLGKEVSKELALLEKPLLELRTALENAVLIGGLSVGVRGVDAVVRGGVVGRLSHSMLPEHVLLRRGLLFGGGMGGGGGVYHDQHYITNAAIRLHRQLERMLQRCQRNDSGFHGVTKHRGQYMAALELVADKVELLRTLRNHHVATVRLELAKAEVEAVQEDVDAAVAARSDDVEGCGCGSMRTVRALADEARALRGRMRYLENQRVGWVDEGDVVVVEAVTEAEMQQGEYVGLLLHDIAHQTGIAAALQFQEVVHHRAPQQPPPPTKHHTTTHTTKCPVCLDNITNTMTMFPCGHWFCQRCAEHLGLQCAVCRQRARNTQQLFRVTLATGTPQTQQQQDPSFVSSNHHTPIGSWGTKIEALLRRILALQATHPDQKSLIFSQFPEALKLIARALDVNSVKHVMLTGGRRAARAIIQSFEHDDDVRVFLLPMKTAAAGLTLTRASHVFLLEPAMDPAVEQQAVARVHRIGQTRPVTVHRLLVEDTVEELVLEVNESRGGVAVGGGVVVGKKEKRVEDDELLLEKLVRFC